MTQQKERQVLMRTGVASFALAVLFFVLTIAFGGFSWVWGALFTLVLGLASECGIRLLLTTKLPYDHSRLFVTTSGFFQKNRFDKWLIQKDPLRRWADLSDYDSDAFSVVSGQRELTVQHTCTLEVMNLLAAVLSYLPLLFIIPADRKGVAFVILLVLSILFSIWAAFSAARARHYRFQVKAGRI